MTTTSNITGARQHGLPHSNGEASAPDNLPNFTPGPWALAHRAQTRGRFLVVDSTSAQSQVAFADDEDELIDSATAKANARLIAAAPEMLDALEGVVAWIDGDYAEDTPECRRIMRAKLAIAKALGK